MVNASLAASWPLIICMQLSTAASSVLQAISRSMKRKLLGHKTIGTNKMVKRALAVPLGPGNLRGSREDAAI